MLTITKYAYVARNINSAELIWLGCTVVMRKILLAAGIVVNGLYFAYHGAQPDYIKAIVLLFAICMFL